MHCLSIVLILPCFGAGLQPSNAFTRSVRHQGDVLTAWELQEPSILYICQPLAQVHSSPKGWIVSEISLPSETLRSARTDPVEGSVNHLALRCNRCVVHRDRRHHHLRNLAWSQLLGLHVCAGRVASRCTFAQRAIIKCEPL